MGGILDKPSKLGPAELFWDSLNKVGFLLRGSNGMNFLLAKICDLRLK